MVINKVEAENVFASGDVECICDTLVAISFYEQDWHWVQDKCLFFLESKNPTISGLAATCLGHIARIHRQIEKDKVLKQLKLRLNEVEIAGRIEDAIDDIEMFVN